MSQSRASGDEPLFPEPQGLAEKRKLPSDDLPRGASIGRYLIIERLGSGGMGVVYSAYDPDLNRRVAIKLLRSQPGALASQGRARLLREAQSMARLSHPNVVAVFDVGVAFDQVFVAMEFIEGATLGEWLQGALLEPFADFFRRYRWQAALILALFRVVPLLDRHLERTLMVVAYLAIAAIIFVEVIRRFTLNLQEPWSTTLPPYLFLLLTWFGCAYNVRTRTHLSFGEFRSRMSRGMQLICLWLDGALWLGMAWIVIVTTLRVTANSASNFQILLGTDHVMIWWFTILVPLSFIILAARAVECSTPHEVRALVPMDEN